MTPDREPLWLTWSELKATLARTGARWKKAFPDWMRNNRRWALNYENLRAEVVPGSSPLEPDPLVLALYAELGRRRDSMDTLMWQVPAFALAASRRFLQQWSSTADPRAFAGGIFPMAAPMRHQATGDPARHAAIRVPPSASQ